MRPRHPIARRCRSLALAAALIGAGAAPARADEMAEAKEHFKKGQTHYALGEFAEAVAEFRDAYRLRDEPAILFNIAQAMRQLGQYKQAHFYYSQYLSRRPEAGNRADVEQFMAQMRRKADAEEEAERVRREGEAARAQAARAIEPQAVAPASAPTAIVVSPPGTAVAGVGASAGGAAGPLPEVEAGAPGAAPDAALRPGPAPPWTRHEVLRFSGLGAIGVGVVVEGLALAFHASAQASADELSRKYQSGTLQPSDSALQRNVSSKGRLSTIAALGGAVLIAAGATAVLAF